MNSIAQFADTLETAALEFNFGDKVRVKGMREIWLVTGTEWIMRGDGSTFERVYLARMKQGSQRRADELEFAK